MTKEMIIYKNKYDAVLFYNNFILNKTENEFFIQLENILKKNISIFQKQRNIEKLINIYLLNKTEKKININPF